MTGFGRGLSEAGGVRATVDVRTVNHRFLDLKIRGTGLSPALEDAIGARVRGAIERGSVVVSVHTVRVASAAELRIDAAVAARMHATLAALAAKLGTSPPELALVLAQPGVVVTGDDRSTDDAPAIDPVVLAALDIAVAQLATMRDAEGCALGAEVATRLGELTALRARLATLAATVPGAAARRLHERVAKLLADTSAGSVLDQARLAQEIAILADRTDITEELVRLASHLDQCEKLATGPSASGRRLDFLLQELGRELNTIGSKSATAELTAAVVEGKAALEKLREQVQNVE